MVVVAPFGSSVPADVQALVNKAAADVAKGFNPFTGPIKDNTGRVVLPLNATVGADQIGSMNWYVEGVVGKVR